MSEGGCLLSTIKDMPETPLSGDPPPPGWLRESSVRETSAALEKMTRKCDEAKEVQLRMKDKIAVATEQLRVAVADAATHSKKCEVAESALAKLSDEAEQLREQLRASGQLAASSAKATREARAEVKDLQRHLLTMEATDGMAAIIAENRMTTLGLREALTTAAQQKEDIAVANRELNDARAENSSLRRQIGTQASSWHSAAKMALLEAEATLLRKTAAEQAARLESLGIATTTVSHRDSHEFTRRTGINAELLQAKEALRVELMKLDAVRATRKEEAELTNALHAELETSRVEVRALRTKLAETRAERDAAKERSRELRRKLNHTHAKRWDHRAAKVELDHDDAAIARMASLHAKMELLHEMRTAGGVAEAEAHIAHADLHATNGDLHVTNAALLTANAELEEEVAGLRRFILGIHVRFAETQLGRVRRDSILECSWFDETHP
jgi:hypothetical protein